MYLTLFVQQLTSSLSQVVIPCELHHVSSRLEGTPSLIIRHLSSKPFSKKNWVLYCVLKMHFFLIIAAGTSYLDELLQLQTKFCWSIPPPPLLNLVQDIWQKLLTPPCEVSIFLHYYTSSATFRTANSVKIIPTVVPIFPLFPKGSGGWVFQSEIRIFLVRIVTAL